MNVTLSRTADSSNQSKMSRMRLLRESINRPPVTVSQTRRDDCATLGQNNVANPVRKENVSRNNLNTPSTEELGGGQFTTEKLRCMSFRPMTMPKPRAAEANQPEVDSEISHGSVTISRPNFSSHMSARRRCSSKNPSKMGVWMKRLALLKSNQTNNVIKLQHAGMNRHGTTLDLNDPRRTANTYTDITILSNEDCNGVSIKSWGLKAMANVSSLGDGVHLTIPSFIHEHAHFNSSVGESLTKTFGWVSFTPVTVRNVGLQMGMQLRIYDAILLPVRRSNAGNITSNEIHTDYGYVVVCTQLCERHPGGLSPVPSMDPLTTIDNA